MINETAQLTQKITYESLTNITHNPIFIATLILIWFVVGIVLYLIVAGSTRARTSDGQKLKRSMLSSPNAWLVPLIIWLLQLGLILILWIFPIWTKINF